MHTYGQFVFDKGVTVTQWRKDSLFNNAAETTAYLHANTKNNKSNKDLLSPFITNFFTRIQKLTWKNKS